MSLSDIAWLAWLAPLVMVWGQVRTALSRVSSYLFVRGTVEGQLAQMVHKELWLEWRPVPLGDRLHFTRWFDGKIDGTATNGWLLPVVLSTFSGTLLFRKGLRFVMWNPSSEGEQGKLVCLRWNVNYEGFVADCSRKMLEWQVSDMHRVMDRQRGKGSGYCVSRIYGTAGERMSMEGIGREKDGPEAASGGAGTPAHVKSVTTLGQAYHVPYHLYPTVNVDRGDLGWFGDGDSEQFYLDPALTEVVREVEAYIEGVAWMRARGIPHRRGVALTGPPGTGKSGFVHWLARTYRLPLVVPELATFQDKDLKKIRDATKTPGILLFEDFDAIFEGRKNVVEFDGMKLTFDAFINLLSGVESINALVFFTTNHPEKLDGALTRPGRIDRSVEVPLLGRDGRAFLARRILAGCPPGDERRLVEEEPDQPAAEFENKCIQAALAHFWDTRASRPTH